VTGKIPGIPPTNTTLDVTDLFAHAARADVTHFCWSLRISWSDTAAWHPTHSRSLIVHSTAVKNLIPQLEQVASAMHCNLRPPAGWWL